MKQAGVEPLEFGAVLNFLAERIPINQHAGSESEHVIRLMRIYGLCKVGDKSEERVAATKTIAVQ
jgi:hypothetical protein